MIKIIHQPFDEQLGSILSRMLLSGSYTKFTAVTAFAKNSGVLRLMPALKSFKQDHGGRLCFYIGVDLGGTSYEALLSLLEIADELAVIHTEAQQSFHPKLYSFSGGPNAAVIIGSNNLTAGGLWHNFESAVLLSSEDGDVNPAFIQQNISAYLSSLSSLGLAFRPIKTAADVEALLNNGYVSKEIALQLRSRSAASRPSGDKKLFGGGLHTSIPPLEQLTQSAADNNAEPLSLLKVYADAGEQTLWMESRSLTGGSRNIIDLSMQARIVKSCELQLDFTASPAVFMQGAVEFFGIEPEKTAERRDITLNFNGVDYFGNTILFPAGSKANGTWRLQVKGVSAAGVKITDAFRALGEEHYLTDKIISFTKIEPDHYTLSVSPLSELEHFKACSRIVALNGHSSRSKLMGLF